MADFTIPFARDGEKEDISTSDQTNGIPCGPLRRGMHNRLHHDVQAELGHLIDFAGVTPDPVVHTKVREAIEALIDAATGAGDTSQYLLVSQARARLPIFPEILSADGKINITSPAAGTVRIPSGVNFLHRGIFPITTTQTDFGTDASKNYHVRWSSSSGYELKDLAGATYNPDTLAESDAAFDSSYDDMLMARVVTNSSNVPTITNLVNQSQITFSGIVTSSSVALDGLNGANHLFQQSLNWSRTPKFRSIQTVSLGYNDQLSTDDMDINLTVSGVNRNQPLNSETTAIPLTRYGLDLVFMRDNTNTMSIDFNALA